MGLFDELTLEEMAYVEGGKPWYEWMGDIGAAVCTGCATYLTIASGPVGWTIAATAGAGFWTAIH